MKLTNINKIYHNKLNDVQALNNINLTFNNHGMTFIIGSSGCGKTTLLNIIAGYDKDFEGVIEYDGKVECIEQDILLMENLSVLDNLNMVSDDTTQIDALLKRFHLIDEAHKKVKKLSGGEKKRVQIIRSLLNKATYLICDEPTASLDHDNGELIMTMLKEVSKDIGVIIVTHDIALVDKYSDRTIQMGKGVILEDELMEDIHKETAIVDDTKDFRQQFTLLFKLIKSRWQESLFRYTILFFTVFIIFVLTFLFPSLNAKVDATANWLNEIR